MEKGRRGDKTRTRVRGEKEGREKGKGWSRHRPYIIYLCASSLNFSYIFFKIFKESITNIRKKYEKINFLYGELNKKTVPLEPAYIYMYGE